jgi:transmembrane 9 superfamily member 2/4
VKPYSENLGEFLRGDRIENSPYQIYMLQDEFCKVLCQVDLKLKDTTAFRNAIKRQYHHNWIVDNLPAASILDSDQYVTTQYVGFPVGYISNNVYYIYNHVNIILEYHTVDTDGHRIVGFYVEPLSVKHEYTGEYTSDENPPKLTTCSASSASSKHLEFDSIKEHQRVATGKMIFTYGVEFRPSDVKWASRWDVYLSMNHAVPDQIHWYSIMNSLLIVLFLAFMVAMILVRTLTHEINKYNKVSLPSLRVTLHDHARSILRLWLRKNLTC